MSSEKTMKKKQKGDAVTIIDIDGATPNMDLDQPTLLGKTGKRKAGIHVGATRRGVHWPRWMKLHPKHANALQKEAVHLSRWKPRSPHLPVSNLTDSITESNSPAMANDVIQKSVKILLACEDGENTANQYSSSISMVPSRLRDLSPKSFDPTVVSIGPLHHEDQNLKKFEGVKRKYMFDLLGSPPEETLAACLRKVSQSIQKIRKCYVGTKPYSDDELARMMVMDGCFILEFLSNSKEGNYLLWEQINTDLLLVENQIPFFVLEDIFQCTILKSYPRASLIGHFKGLLECGHDFFFTGYVKNPNYSACIPHRIDHILNLLHECYQPTYTRIPGPLIDNIVKLEKAGVSFKPNKDVKSPLAIEIEWSRSAWIWFWFKPTLRIPEMTIDDDTEMILRNMIAYEQTSDVSQYLTSYALAMDHLVDSGDDIDKLVDSKVLLNNLGSSEEAANMFNKICKNVAINNPKDEKWKKLETYYTDFWPKHIAWLRRTYFNNPWNIIALIAGIILFVLTLTQTYFTVNPIK